MQIFDRLVAEVRQLNFFDGDFESVGASHPKALMAVHDVHFVANLDVFDRFLNSVLQNVSLERSIVLARQLLAMCDRQTVRIDQAKSRNGRVVPRISPQAPGALGK